jgi:NADH-quinone oxidoreductase subunit I
MYDLGSCTFCGLCVSTCPTDAIEFSNDFEQAVFRREALLKQLNYLPEKEKPAPEPKPAPAPKPEAAKPAAQEPKPEPKVEVPKAEPKVEDSNDVQPNVEQKETE